MTMKENQNDNRPENQNSEIIRKSAYRYKCSIYTGSIFRFSFRNFSEIARAKNTKISGFDSVLVKTRYF